MFIDKDLPKYGYKLDIDYVGKQDPILILLDVKGREIRELDITGMSRKEIRSKMEELGLSPRQKLSNLGPDNDL